MKTELDGIMAHQAEILDNRSNVLGDIDYIKETIKFTTDDAEIEELMESLADKKLEVQDLFTHAQ